MDTPQNAKKGLKIADNSYFLPFIQRLPEDAYKTFDSKLSSKLFSPFKSYHTPIEKEQNRSLFEMVEMRENNKNANEKSSKTKWAFHFIMRVTTKSRWQSKRSRKLKITLFKLH